MSLTVQTVFRNMERSEWIEALVEKYAAKLDSICDRIVSCKVTIGTPRKHHGKETFSVKVDLCVPGTEIVVNGSEVVEDQSLNKALREAFDSAKRQVLDYVRMRRGEVKTHQQAELDSASVEEDESTVAVEDYSV